jgi:hypothetical protein
VLARLDQLTAKLDAKSYPAEDRDKPHRNNGLHAVPVK